MWCVICNRIQNNMYPDTEPCNRIHKMVSAKMKSDTIIFFIENDFFHKGTLVICYIYLSNLLKNERFIYLLIPLTFVFLLLPSSKKNISFTSYSSVFI